MATPNIFVDTNTSALPLSASNANTLFLLFSEQVVKRYVDVCLE